MNRCYLFAQYIAQELVEDPESHWETHAMAEIPDGVADQFNEYDVSR